MMTNKRGGGGQATHAIGQTTWFYDMRLVHGLLNTYIQRPEMRACVSLGTQYIGAQIHVVHSWACHTA